MCSRWERRSIARSSCGRPFVVTRRSGLSACVNPLQRVTTSSLRAADVPQPLTVFRCAVLSAVKHDYVARGVASHPRFKLAVVADDPQVPQWAHERNQQLADAFQIPYVCDVEKALREFNVQVAVVSPEAERHCDLSIRAVKAGKHVIQDKPLAVSRSEADALVAAIEESGVRFLMWNRNFIPAVLNARDQIQAGMI